MAVGILWLFEIVVLVSPFGVSAHVLLSFGILWGNFGSFGYFRRTKGC